MIDLDRPRRLAERRKAGIWPAAFDIAGTIAMLAAVITVMAVVALGWLE